MGKMDELKRITKELNSKHKRSNPEAEEPIVFIAKGNEKLLDFGLLRTGNPAMDGALGGGIPRGTIFQITGPAGVGKSRSMLEMIGYNHREDPNFIGMYVHLEARAFPLKAALDAGIDLDRLLIVNAQASGERTFDIMLRYLWNWETNRPVGAVDLVVIDSIAAAVPAQELGQTKESGLESMTVGAQARMMSKAFRIITGSGCLGKSVIGVINQVRTDINSYGGGETNPGGNSVKHYPKITMTMRSRASEYLKRKEKIQGATVEVVYGHKIRGEVVKNNAGYGHPHQPFEYTVVYGKGVNLLAPTIDLALRLDIIQEPKTTRFEIPGFEEETVKLHGRNKVEDWVENTPGAMAWLAEQITHKSTWQADQQAPVGELPNLDELELPDPEATLEGD